MEEGAPNDGARRPGPGRPPREDEDPVDERRVRQRVARVMESRVELNRQTIRPKSSPLPGVQRRNQIGPSCRLIPLEQHVANGPEFNTMFLLIVMSIRTSSENDRTMVQQRFGGGVRGQRTNVRYQRRILLMCPLSSPGNNMAMMFSGHGHNRELFECEAGLRTDGSLRKCHCQ